MAESSNQRQRKNDDVEEDAHKERARRAFVWLQSLSVGMDATTAGRAAQRLSNWADPTHLQWKDVNNRVMTQQVRDVWEITDGEAKKGRWKIFKCTNQEIRDNAERIALEVFGQPLHNTDAPLYFAKILYAHFVLRIPVDFSSKEPKHLLSDIRAQSITITRDDLKLALEGSALHLSQETKTLRKKIQEITQEKDNIIAGQTPPHVTAGIVGDLRTLSSKVDVISRRMPGQTVKDLVQHPSKVIPADVPTVTEGVVCPVCTQFMDPLTGEYRTPCGHIYDHLSCLLQRMNEALTCQFCGEVFPQLLYKVFQLSVPGATSSVARNLHFSNLNDDGASQAP